MTTSPEASARNEVEDGPPLDDQELLDLLLVDDKIERPREPEIRRSGATAPPLSRAQRRLWFLQQVAPGSAAYNIAFALKLSGRLHIDAFRRGFNEIVRRHEALRTCFPAVDGRPSARVRGEWQLDIPVDDLAETDGSLQSGEVSRACVREAAQPFDLQVGPLIRVRLLRLAELDHVALLVMHHIVADGWSMGVLITEFGQLYEALSHGRPSPLNEPTLQYSDFAEWQQHWLEGLEAASQRKWWKERLARLAPLEMPIDRRRPAEPSHRGRQHAFPLPSHLGVSLRSLEQREGATLFMTLLAAFAVLLHRYTGQADIVVGSPVANRNRREIEPLIGMFVNSLVMRCDLSGEPDFLTVLRRVRDFTLDALAHQDLPFEEVIRELAPERDTSGNPLFQVMFSVENLPAVALQLPDIVLTSIEVETHSAKSDLLLNMSVTDGGRLVGAFEYATDLFDADTIARMARHFGTLLEAIVADPHRRVSTLPMLTPEERDLLLVEWNGSAPPYPRETCIQRLFEAQAERTPNAPAVVWGGQRLSYRQLNRCANQMARYLRSLGLVEGQLVGFHLPRSTEMIVAMLAILKAGCAYVPLDTAYPAERLILMLEDCGAPVVLTHGTLLADLGKLDARLVPFDTLHDELDRLPDGNLPESSDAEQLAYVIYTSGSTGVPKGVAVPHRAVIRLVCNCDFAQLGTADRVAQASNASFDAATFEIWGALLNGGVLVGVEREATLSPRRLAELLRAEQITTIFLTTALFNQIACDTPDAFRPVRQVLFGGEAVDPQSVRHVLHFGRPERLLHVYGPTENTTFSTAQLVEDVPAEATTVPIGRAIANSRLYVLDRHLCPVPVGVPGELYLGGDGVAQGYLNRPGLTAERFVPDPFDSFAGARLYRSGDVGRYRNDGSIEFIGRIDNQVKLRGFRVELGEIETALVGHVAVREAVVLAREDQTGRRELVAYVVAEPGHELEPQVLRRELADRLPGYMVPSKYVVLHTLPLNENGKVDRAALPMPVDASNGSESHQAPRDEREESLASVWQDVLGRCNPGIDDSYFHLGGDSITAIQIVSRLRRLGWQMRVTDLFRHPTIAELAPYLRRSDARAGEPADANLPNDVPLTAVQRWFFENYRGDLDHFNQAVLLRPAEALDEGHLRSTLTELLRRHDALRLRFATKDGSIRQTSHSAGDLPALEVADLRGAKDSAAAFNQRVDAAHKGLDLERGVLFKALLFRLEDGDRLLLVVHHLVVDTVSWRILLEELDLGYRQVAAGEVISLGPPPYSFRRWADEVSKFAAGEDLAREAAYWAHIEGAEVTRLPTAKIESGLQHGEAQALHLSLSSEDTTQLLTRAHRAFDTDIMSLLLTALGRALKRWSGGEKTRITLEGHGREPLDEAVDLSRTVGWFTSLYPLVLRIPGENIGEQIRCVQEALRELPRNGFGYGVLRYLSDPGDRFRAAPRPQLSFNYLGQITDESDSGLFKHAEESSGRAISPQLTRVHELDVAGVITGGRLILSLEFDPRMVVRESAVALLEDIGRQLEEVARCCMSRVRDGDAPSASAASPWGHLPIAQHVEDAYPLSPLQAGILFQSLLDPGSQSYFVQMRFRFNGSWSWDAFRGAWFALCRRHAILRSAFIHQGVPRPMQVVLEDCQPVVTFEDFGHLTDAERAERLEAFCLDDQRKGFDLQQRALLRVAVFRERENDYQIVWSYHHILLDGWCLAILRRDFRELYAALLERRPPRLAKAAPYRNYIRWLDAQDGDSARQFWRCYLAGYEQLATVPKLTRPDDGIERSLSDEILLLDADQSAGLVRLAAANGVTLNAVMLGLWGLLLSRYNDREDVVFGTVVSGRPAELPGIEDMVGLFICAVPVRVRIKSDMSFPALVRSVQDDVLASEPHRHFPLVEIQQESVLGRHLFDHMLVFENYPLQAAAGGAESSALAEFTPLSAYDPTHYDLALTVVPGERIAIKFTFDRRVYTIAQIRRTAEHLRTAAASVRRNPEQALRDVAILPPSEQELLLETFNDTAVEYPRDKSFVDLFEERAVRTPDAIAVRCADLDMSYLELNRAANRLAHRLRSLGVRAGVAVGLCVERTLDIVVGPLAILKAGGIFVPLDPDYPPARLAFMLLDAGISVLLTQQGLTARLPEYSGAVVLLDVDEQPIRTEPDHNPHRHGDAGQVAYVIYTSGSTGRPKGVTVAHGSLMNYLNWASRYYYPAGDGGSFGLFTSLAFDLTITSLFLPLIRGRTLRIFPPEATLESVLRAYFDSTAGLDSIKLTPAHISVLSSLGLAGSRVDVAVVGGEQLLPSQLNCLRALNPQMRIYNEYGPTEATVGCVVKQILPDETQVLIGRPIDNTRAYVLDKHLRLLPLGVPGQLFIGGHGLARGYLNRPDLTAEKFIADPFSAGPAARLYCSGDQARWLPDGNMEFLGRIDGQVKVRGYRIELGEIEHHLLRCEWVEQAVVVARETETGTDLAAYVVADSRWDADGVREALKQSLPHYMVPTFFVRLDRFPLSSSAKADRNALPDPRIGAERQANFLAPRTATEESLAAIWRDVLQTDQLGVFDDFFELGGHSLKAMQITGQIHKTFGVRVSLREFFARPTISDLARIIDAGSPSAWSHIPLAARQEHYELSPAQRRLWMLHQMEGAATYNMPSAHLIEAEIDADVLGSAFRTLIARHESLRTAFVVIDGEPRQRILADIPFSIAHYDLRDDPAAEERARAIADRDANRSFDLTAPPLLRVALVRLPGGRCLFTMTIHHVVFDGWSGNLLYRELLRVYDAYLNGRPNPLKPMRIQYKDFSDWQNTLKFEQEERYWLPRLSGMPERLLLPYDFTPEAIRDFSGANASIELSGEIVTKLRDFAIRKHTTLSNVILALFTLFLYNWTRQEDICVGMSVANRSHSDVETLIGFFVNLLPIHVRLNADMEFDDLLDLVIERSHEALEHQDYPFDLMIQNLNPTRRLNRRPLVNVIYAYQNFSDIHLDVESKSAARTVVAQQRDGAPRWAGFDLSFRSVKFDLTFCVTDDPEAVQMTLDYDSSLFLAETIRTQLQTIGQLAGMIAGTVDH